MAEFNKKDAEKYAKDVLGFDTEDDCCAVFRLKNRTDLGLPGRGSDGSRMNGSDWACVHSDEEVDIGVFGGIYYFSDKDIEEQAEKGPLHYLNDERGREDGPRKATAYTDGSYNADTGEYGAGVVLFTDRSEKPVTEAFSGRADDGENGWQVNGEIAAAKRAIELAMQSGYSSLEIHHDYEGVGAWPDRKWKAKKNYTRRYADFVNAARKRIDISFVHVKGHSGDEWNEMADKLAGEACGIR